MKTKLSLCAIIALLGSTLSATTTAAAESADRAQETKAKIDGARAEIAKIRTQVGVTLEELNRVRKDNVNLRIQFEQYSKELAKMEEQAALARERAVSMAEKGLAYFEAWGDTVKSISNKEIREQATNRYNKRAKSYGKVVKAMAEAREELKPFMSDLTDIKKLLDSELSRDSVKAAGPLIKQANKRGEEVARTLKGVEDELDRVSGELAKYE